MDRAQSKIFGIGLSKTGTSSLAQALQRLGYRTKDCMGAARYAPGDLSSIDMDTVLAHDALTDTPIPSFYRELDARFPGSKFILTVRDREGWLKSCEKQFNERSAAAQNDAHRRIFEDLYGTNVFDESGFASGYERFVAGVLAHFKDRPEDLLIMNVASGDGWERLCPFLGRAVPDFPFPKANVTKIRWMNIEDLVAVAEAAGNELLKRYKGSLEPAAQSAWAGRAFNPGTALGRALHAVLGRDATQAAMRAAHKEIVARLKRLTPEIAVLSPMEEPPANVERRQWNHAWVVDPLDGVEAFANGRSDFSVNLALVEDGRPIYGVVHAPAKGVTYFGRVGRGVSRRIVGDAPVQVTGRSRMAAESTPPRRVEADENSSRALSMCEFLEKAAGIDPVFGPTREWRAAAAHALLRLAELQPVECGSLQEPMYNSRELAVGALTILPDRPIRSAGDRRSRETESQ